jgi:hypothetical protein
MQVDVVESHCDSVLKETFSGVGVPRFYTYLPPAQIWKFCSIYLPNVCYVRYHTFMRTMFATLEAKQVVREITINR